MAHVIVWRCAIERIRRRRRNRAHIDRQNRSEKSKQKERHDIGFPIPLEALGWRALHRSLCGLEGGAPRRQAKVVVVKSDEESADSTGRIHEKKSVSWTVGYEIHEQDDERWGVPLSRSHSHSRSHSPFPWTDGPQHCNTQTLPVYFTPLPYLLKAAWRQHVYKRL